MTSGQRPLEDVVYPGAPLRAVAIEVRFSALLDAMTRFGAFQRKHAAEFDQLYETSVEQRHSMPDGREFARPRTGVLMSSTGDRAVSIASDQIAVITYPYKAGFAGFRTWAVPLLREGIADVGAERITRVGYRYENRIEQATDDFDLGSMFNISLASGESAGKTKHAHLYWHQRVADGVVEVELDACDTMSPQEVRLNITAYCKNTTGSIDGIDDAIDQAHTLARRSFEEMITPSFRERLRSPSADLKN